MITERQRVLDKHVKALFDVNNSEKSIVLQSVGVSLGVAALSALGLCMEPDFAMSSNRDEKQDKITMYEQNIVALEQQKVRQNNNDTLARVQIDSNGKLGYTLISKEIAESKNNIATVKATPDEKLSSWALSAVLFLTMGAGAVSVVRKQSNIYKRREEHTKALEKEGVHISYPYKNNDVCEGLRKARKSIPNYF